LAILLFLFHDTIYLLKSHHILDVFIVVILYTVVWGCNRMWSCGCLNFVCFCILGSGHQYWILVAGHLSPAYGTIVDHVGIVWIH